MSGNIGTAFTTLHSAAERRLRCTFHIHRSARFNVQGSMWGSGQTNFGTEAELLQHWMIITPLSSLYLFSLQPMFIFKILTLKIDKFLCLSCLPPTSLTVLCTHITTNSPHPLTLVTEIHPLAFKTPFPHCFCRWLLFTEFTLKPRKPWKYQLHAKQKTENAWEAPPASVLPITHPRCTAVW